jgi:hypothetical protein
VTAVAVSDHDPELRAMRRPFRRALLGVVIGFVLVGGLIAAFGTGRDRAEGAAERWLSEVGDTTRKGVSGDAKRYIAEHGGEASVAALLPTDDVDGKSAFTSLEVGKASKAADGTERVPYLLEQRDDKSTKVEGTLVLTRAGDDWRVVGSTPRAPGEKVPSEGGPAIAKAPLGLYTGGVVVGIGVTLVCSALLRRVGDSSRANDT